MLEYILLMTKIYKSTYSVSSLQFDAVRLSYFQPQPIEKVTLCE